jgi:hypothetical protein
MVPIPYQMSSGYLQSLEMHIIYRQPLAKCQVDLGKYLTNVSADVGNPLANALLWILTIILQMASGYLQTSRNIYFSSILISF